MVQFVRGLQGRGGGREVGGRGDLRPHAAHPGGAGSRADAPDGVKRWSRRADAPVFPFFCFSLFLLFFLGGVLFVLIFFGGGFLRGPLRNPWLFFVSGGSVFCLFGTSNSGPPVFFFVGSGFGGAEVEVMTFGRFLGCIECTTLGYIRPTNTVIPQCPRQHSDHSTCEWSPNIVLPAN